MTRRHPQPLPLALSLTLLAALALPAQAQVAVVVSAKSTASNLTAEQAAALFTGKTQELPGVGLALLLDLPDGAPAREQFYGKVTGKTAAQIKAGWSRLTFSGKGTPPKEVPSSADVKKLVANNANAVGYIEKSAVDASVKVLFATE
jgi:ABC-type phosphate transport system substrate-binding protein